MCNGCIQTLHEALISPAEGELFSSLHADKSDDEEWLLLLLSSASLSFDAQTLQWQWPDGRVITSLDARQIVDTHIARTAARLDILSLQLQSGTIDVTTWKSGFRAILRPALTSAALAGSGGLARVSSPDLARMTVLLDLQDAYLDNFAASLTSKPHLITKPGLRVRSALYAHAMRGVYESERERLAVSAGFKFERLIAIRMATEHCPDCIRDVNRGKVPIGTLKPIGTRQCLVLCTHSKEFSFTDE